MSVVAAPGSYYLNVAALRCADDNTQELPIWVYGNALATRAVLLSSHASQWNFVLPAPEPECNDRPRHGKKKRR
jgi:hypothetical protein